MSKYVKQFLNRRSCADLIPLFANCKNCHKEITESMGMLEAVRTFSDPDINDYDKFVIVVGDGITPRTAGLIAFNTRINCISVDPVLDRDFCDKWFEDVQVKGLAVEVNKVEDIEIRPLQATCIMKKEVIIIYPHSHAPMGYLYGLIKAPSVITIAMPCCIPVPPSRANQRHISYVDKNILSGKNKIHVWHHVMDNKGVMVNAIGINRARLTGSRLLPYTTDQEREEIRREVERISNQETLSG